MKAYALILFIIVNILSAKAQVFLKATSTEQITGDTECILVSGTYAAADIRTATFLNREEVEINSDGSIHAVSDACIYTIKKNSGKRGLINKDGQYLVTDSENKFFYSTTNTAQWNLEEKNGGVVLYTSPNYYLVSSTWGNEDHKFQVYIKNNHNDYAYIYIKTEGDEPPTPPEQSITIGDEIQDNTAIIATYKGQQADIEIGRTFLNDNGWYTLCLPIALTADDILNTLKAEKVLKFCGASSDDNGTIVLSFQPVRETEAGKPYLLKVAEEVRRPVFKAKTITAPEPFAVTVNDQRQQACQMIGIYDPTSFSGYDAIDQVRFISGNDGISLRKPSTDGQLKGLRAYFLLPKGIAKASIDTTDGLPTLNFRCRTHVSGIYDTMGKPVSKTAHGVVIINGKKHLTISAPTP